MRSAIVELVGGSVDKRSTRSDADQQVEGDKEEEELPRKQTTQTTSGGSGSFGAEPQEVSATSTQYFKPIQQPALAAAPSKPTQKSDGFQSLGSSGAAVPSGRVAEQGPQKISLEKVSPPVMPSTAIRPPPPPTESIDTATTTAESAANENTDEDQDMNVEKADQEQVLEEEDVSMNADIQAPFALAGGVDDDDSDSDPDAPLPKIVLDDSDDE
jgi:hypothetical protein